MPDDADRMLARLAVEAGFLTKDEAMRYWQQCQQPGAPRFIQLLVQSQRLSPADLNQLKLLWQRSSSGAVPALNSSVRGPAPGPAPSAAVAVAPPPQVAVPSGPGPPANGLKSTDDGSWEEALEKDTQLARTLFSRGLVTQERLRECRALQLQHRLRLGVVLVKKGYVDPRALEEAHGGPAAPAGPGSAGHARPAPPPGLGTSGRMARPAPTTPSNPFQAPPGGVVDQDAMPTLNMPPGSYPPGSPLSALTPSAGPQDAIPTILGGGGDQSVEELNPFAMGLMGPGGPPGRGGSPAAPGAPADGMLSRDELGAFEDLPLGPPPSPGAAPGFLPAGSAAEGDITMPPGYAPPGQDGIPTTAAPAVKGRSSTAEAHLPDSGGEKPAAPRKPKKATTARPAPSTGGGNARLFIMLGVGGLLIVVAAVAAWALGVFG